MPTYVWLREASLPLGPLPFPLLLLRAGSFERPVSGLVTKVYVLSQTVYLGSEKFHVPKDVYDLSDLSVGAYVVIAFERLGGRLLATSLEVDPATFGLQVF